MNRTQVIHDGFNYGLVINCTTADTSIAAGEQKWVNTQKLEGQDLQQFKKGTSCAETILTISFYAKGSGECLQGFCLFRSIFDNDNT